MSTSPSKKIRLPLSDRSNNPDTAPSPSTPQRWPGKQVRRKVSDRNLFPNLDSSEETPSEHSSICDAVDWASEDFLGSAEFIQNKENIPEVEPAITELTATNTGMDPIEGGPRFINRPHGTPLETIIEQKSYATLQTKPSLPHLKRLYTPIHLDSTSPYALQHAAPHGDLRRKASFSVNDTDLYELVENFPKPPSRERAVCEKLSVEPQHSAPHRVLTPEGLPRWPGDLPTSNTARPGPRPKRSFRSLFDAFRTSSAPNTGSAPYTGFGHALRNPASRTASSPARTGRSYWRPPQSGQAQYEDLTAHPFHDAPVAAPRAVSSVAEAPRPLYRPASIRSSHDGSAYNYPIPSPTSSQLLTLQSRFMFNERPTPTIRLVTPTSPIQSASDDVDGRSQLSPSRSSLLGPSPWTASDTPPPHLETGEAYIDEPVLLGRQGAEISSLDLEDTAAVPVNNGALRDSTRSRFSNSTTSNMSQNPPDQYGGTSPLRSPHSITSSTTPTDSERYISANNMRGPHTDIPPYDPSASANSLRTYATTPLPLFHTHAEHIPAPASLYAPHQPINDRNNSTRTFQSFRTSSLQTAQSTSTPSIDAIPTRRPINDVPRHPITTDSLPPSSYLSPFPSASPSTRQNSPHTSHYPSPLRVTSTPRPETSIGSMTSTPILQHPRPVRSSGLDVRDTEWINRVSGADEEEGPDADMERDRGFRDADEQVNVDPGAQPSQPAETCPHRRHSGTTKSTSKFRKHLHNPLSTKQSTPKEKEKGQMVQAKCWRCAAGDKSRSVVTWILGRCFCQPIDDSARPGRACAGGMRRGRGRGRGVVGEAGDDGDGDAAGSVLEPARRVLGGRAGLVSG